MIVYVFIVNIVISVPVYQSILTSSTVTLVLALAPKAPYAQIMLASLLHVATGITEEGNGHAHTYKYM